MTGRSAIVVLLGLLGAAIICGVGYFNDAVMRQTFLVGNNMPIAVYGSLILFVILINPLLFRIWKKLALSGRELAIILTLTLAACCIPGSGLLRTFTPSIILPFHYARTTPGWQQNRLVERVPDHMLAHVTEENEGEVLNGFVQGLGVADKHIPFSRVPWYAWKATLWFWIPLILLLWIGLLGLGMVVHRQWADHEQLPYPIATFTQTLLPKAGEMIADTLRNRLFWISMIAVLVIHLNNYATAWFPNLIKFPLAFDFYSLHTIFLALTKGSYAIGFGTPFIIRPSLLFTVIAFAYFLATDVSLALGIGPVLWAVIAGVMTGYGISLANKTGSLSLGSFLACGAYIGMFLVLLYTGRRYYAEIFRNVLKRRIPAGTHSESVWGARVFLAATLLLIGYLTLLAKLDWQLSVIYVVMVVLIFLVMSRIVTETGIFFLQPWFNPNLILLGIFGAGALGPQALLILSMLTIVLLVDPREAFMPFVTNSFKLLDLNGVKLGKMAPTIAVALLIGIGVALPVTLYFQYDRGSNMADGWASVVVPKMPFETAMRVEQQLQSQERLAQASAVSGWGHFVGMTPDPKMMVSLFAGIALVLLFTVGRLRFPKWPLHPVLFLMWTTYPGGIFSASILIGCLIKSLVMKFGGGVTYRNLKPLMIGLVAGELTAGVIIIIIGWAYYFITGQPPKVYSIMPG